MDNQAIIIEVGKFLASLLLGGGVGFWIGRKVTIKAASIQNQKGGNGAKMTQVGSINNG